MCISLVLWDLGYHHLVSCLAKSETYNYGSVFCPLGSTEEAWICTQLPTAILRQLLPPESEGTIGLKAVWTQ